VDTQLTPAPHAAPPSAPAAAAERDPMLGRVLGERYRLVARIGEGGMGTVYRAEHVVLRKRMAVKVLRHHLSRDEDLVRRFQQEAIAASEIGQENIVSVTDFGRTPEGSVYFVMEELDGESLAAVLAGSGPLQVERATLVLAQVCRALAAAHAHGIVHRDLKPDNVIVVRREDGTDFVKVVDFGISKTLGEGRERATRDGTIIGTPEYMAPEQGAAATVDHRADVYAFGVLAYELLTGSLPFQGETAIATLLAHQTKAVEPPSRRRPSLPAALEALILKALEKRPDARQQSMAEVAADLTRVLAGFGLPPVYERPPAPPRSHGPLGGLTDRFARGTPGAPRPPARGAGDRPSPAERGATVALDAPAASLRGRRAVALAAAAAAVVLAAAGVAVVRKPARAKDASASAKERLTEITAAAPTAAAAAVASPTANPSATATATPTPTSSANPTPTSSANPSAVPNSIVAAAHAQTPARAASAKAPPMPRPPRTTSTVRVGSSSRPGASHGERFGGATRSEENPFERLDDLKPDPF
jgi:tRNA A-37 threonylcarbamoyl transferase component Bud32